MEANVDGGQEIPKVKLEQKKDYDPACDKNDEKHQVEEVQKPDKNSEINERNAEHKISIVQTEEDDDGGGETQENQKPYQKFNEVQKEEIINQIFEKSKVKLSDGTEAPMYSRGPRYFNGDWPLNCHLCSIGGFPNLKELQSHITKRKHTTFLERMPIDATKYKKGLKQIFTHKLNNPIKIYAGEKITEITPELQDRLLPVQEDIFEPRPPEFVYKILIKSEPLHIYNKEAPVIGLSYCFKMNSVDSIDYYCSLCDVHLNSDAYRHFIGNEHRARYAEKHFPLLLAKISSYLSDLKFKKARKKIKYEVLRKVYRSIEEKKGFRQVHIVQLSVDKTPCKEYCSRILHYGDNHVVTTDEQLKEMIEKCRNGIKILEPDPPKIGVECEYSKALFRGGIEPLKHTPSKEKESPKKPKVPDCDDDKKWDSFRKMFDSALDDIDRKYAYYKQMPEQHPEYEKEQKKFWNRHVEEAEKIGLNPDDSRFKIEWIPYWKDRMRKYYRTSITKAKFRIKKLLNIPYYTREPSPITKEISLRRKRSPSPVLPARRQRTTSPSSPCRARQDQSSPAIAKPLNPPDVISVLRLLTALEDNLGSLGPKAVEYLSKSLLYEKDTGQNANQLLRNQEFYVFFVTAKEKLKGQLITKLITRRKKVAATCAIKEIDTLIELFDGFCERTGKTVKPQEQYERPQIPQQQESCFNNDDQFEISLRPVYNRNIQQDFERNRDDVNQFCQYQERGGGMDQYRNSGDYNNQYGGSQNNYDNANLNQYNADEPNSNQYEQNRSMTSHFNQESNLNQYYRGNQGEVWKSEINMAFHNNANNPQVSGSNFFGGNYGNNGNQRYQDFRSDREGNLSTSYDDRSENYNFDLDYHRYTNCNSNLDSLSGGNYNLTLANRAGNNSSLGCGGNFNTFSGDYQLL